MEREVAETQDSEEFEEVPVLVDPERAVAVFSDSVVAAIGPHGVVLTFTQRMARFSDEERESSVVAARVALTWPLTGTLLGTLLRAYVRGRDRATKSFGEMVPPLTELLERATTGDEREDGDTAE